MRRTSPSFRPRLEISAAVNLAAATWPVPTFTVYLPLTSAQIASASNAVPSLSHCAADDAVRMAPSTARNKMSPVGTSTPEAWPPTTLIPESSKILPFSATTLTPPPVVVMSSCSATAPPPAYRLTLPLVAVMPSASAPPRSSTLMSPPMVRRSVLPLAC